MLVFHFGASALSSGGDSAGATAKDFGYTISLCCWNQVNQDEGIQNNCTFHALKD
jgi:hypothetical protein